ncbi:MAG: metal-dependent hydrolase [Pyrinomonadaceae bacterium]
MDNLTHSLVGLAIAKAGLERASPAATAVCIVAANAPDADILTAFYGSWTYLHHHRGITHSIIGTLALALLIPFLFWIAGWIYARMMREPTWMNFRGLLLASLVASASHTLLDWTNNYGVRPLLPLSNERFYGDLVFIVDPFLWLSLGGAAFLLTAKTKRRAAAWCVLAAFITAALFVLPTRAGIKYPALSRGLWLVGLIGLVVAYRARLGRRWGTAIAVIALALVVVYWAALSVLHNRALARAQSVAAHLAGQRGETPQRLAAMPVLANPLRWQCVAETERATFRFDLALNEKDETVRETARYEKPQGTTEELIAQAAKDSRAKVLLDFARFPVARLDGDCRNRPLVQFADLRYTEPGIARRGNFSLEVPVSCAPQDAESFNR